MRVLLFRACVISCCAMPAVNLVLDSAALHPFQQCCLSAAWSQAGSPVAFCQISFCRSGPFLKVRTPTRLSSHPVSQFPFCLRCEAVPNTKVLCAGCALGFQSPLLRGTVSSETRLDTLSVCNVTQQHRRKDWTGSLCVNSHLPRLAFPSSGDYSEIHVLRLHKPRHHRLSASLGLCAEAEAANHGVAARRHRGAAGPEEQGGAVPAGADRHNR